MANFRLLVRNLREAETKEAMLKKYRRFRKLWVLQGDMMHPEDVKRTQETLVKLSDELAEMEKVG